MYRYIIKIEILKNGHIYYVKYFSDDKNLNCNYFSNFIQSFDFYEQENINNFYDYLMTIKKEFIEVNYD